MENHLSQYLERHALESTARALAAVEHGITNVTGFRHDDMTGMVEVQDGDGVWFGVKGMKWGVSRDSKTLKAEAAKRESTTGAKTADGEAKKVVGAAAGESSSARYARIAAVAKAGGASSLDQQDLAFFNARTDAVAKVNARFKSDPGWLSTTSKKVLLSSTEKAMKDVTDAVAAKYISKPLIESLNRAGITAPTGGSSNN